MNNTMTKQKTTSKALNISLWTAQIVLAAMFLLSGLTKSAQPIEQLSATMPWTADVPLALVRLIGISQLLAAIGLILPSLLRIQPQLTSLAALGLVITMLLAAILHIAKDEFSAIGINIILGAVAGFIAWGRYKKAPITGK
jgi:putative oxidoreductase